MPRAVRNSAPRPIRRLSGWAVHDVATETSIIAAVTEPLTTGASSANPIVPSASRMKGWPKTNGMWLSTYIPTLSAKNQRSAGLSPESHLAAVSG